MSRYLRAATTRPGHRQLDMPDAKRTNSIVTLECQINLDVRGASRVGDRF